MEKELFSRSAKGFDWLLNKLDQDIINQLINKLDCSEIIAKLLSTRNVDLNNPASFLNPTIRDFLPDPFHLLDMDKAAEIIVNSIINKEKIVIFGDYDVDGATSSSLLKRFFMLIGIEADIYIPDRIGEGYGPNIEAFSYLKEKGTDLIITVDCGTSSFEAIEFGVENGLKIIVIDHHLSSHNLPKAHALVNPNRLDETSPYTYLAAVGVAFLLAVAVNSVLRKKGYFEDKPEASLLKLLDIVAIGTICDVVPLESLNRAFVVQGLKILNQRKNIGIAAFCEILKLDNELGTYHLGYVIGPRINAGGRVGESSLGARLLSTDNYSEALEIVHKLDQYNQERRAIEFSVFEQALEQARQQPEEEISLIVKAENWHPGVVGIVAGRLKDLLQKPVAVISLNGEHGKASCRSIPGVDFGSAVVAAKEQGLLINGGGHKMAAGFTVLKENLPALQDFLNQKFSADLSLITGKNNRYFDAYLSVEAVNLALAKQIEQLGPFGPSNPEPKFILKNVYIAKTNIFAETNISCLISCADPKSVTNLLKANAFRAIDTAIGNILLSDKKTNLTLVGYIRINRWKGRENHEFIIEDIINE